MHRVTILCVVASIAGCGGGTTEASEPAQPEPMPDANDPAYAARFEGTVDARISSSRGEEGGIVVLFPRVITSGGDEAPEATEVQAALRAIAERQGRPTDVRPAPERACPREGCLGTAVGAVLLRSGTGCAVVATIARPGPTPTRLVPWAGDVELRNHTVAFREPPESEIRVVDFVPCSDLETALLAAEPDVEEAIGQELRD